MTDAYQCPDCTFPTADPMTLVNHMQAVHGDESFSLQDVSDHYQDPDDGKISNILI